jgi:lysophospholipase L1-like esterase
MLDGTWNVRTVAAGGGRILADISADRVRQITSIRKPDYERDIVLLWAGSNDIYGLPSRGVAPTAPLVVYNGMKSYVDAVQADGFEVWIMNAYPRSAFGFADKNAERIVFNDLIRADNSFADKFLDIDAWSEFKSRLDPTYYQADQTHLTKAGNQLVADRIYEELVTSPLTIVTPSALPAGKISAAYSQAVVSSGGKGKRTISLAAGKLPTGLTLVNGTIQGTPSQRGAFSFTLKVKDGLGTSVNRAYNLMVS